MNGISGELNGFLSLCVAVDLGHHFCCTMPCQKQFTLMNRGRRLQALSWTTQGFSAAKLKKMEIKRATIDVKDVGRKVVSHMTNRITYTNQQEVTLECK